MVSMVLLMTTLYDFMGLITNEWFRRIDVSPNTTMMLAFDPIQYFNDIMLKETLKYIYLE